MGEPLTVSGLCGPLRIFQRVKGHRHSIDDATTAWYALQKSPPVSKALDLGSGVGTVGLAVLWGSSEQTTLTCIEAQAVSITLLRANIECNGLRDRVSVHHADLRELNLPEKFPLITGSPPYFPAHTGVIPEDRQKAYARFELRGDVGDYAKAAKRHLAEEGIFVYCFPDRQKHRGLQLVTEAGLKIVTVREVIPRLGKEPLFSLYVARLSGAGPCVEEPPLIVRDGAGKLTPEMLAIRRSRGFGPEGCNLLE